MLFQWEIAKIVLHLLQECFKILFINLFQLYMRIQVNCNTMIIIVFSASKQTKMTLIISTSNTILVVGKTVN